MPLLEHITRKDGYIRLHTRTHVTRESLEKLEQTLMWWSFPLKYSTHVENIPPLGSLPLFLTLSINRTLYDVQVFSPCDVQTYRNSMSPSSHFRYSDLEWLTLAIFLPYHWWRLSLQPLASLWGLSKQNIVVPSWYHHVHLHFSPSLSISIISLSFMPRSFNTGPPTITKYKTLTIPPPYLEIYLCMCFVFGLGLESIRCGWKLLADA